jgi:hypothetical protein
LSGRYLSEKALIPNGAFGLDFFFPETYNYQIVVLQEGFHLFTRLLLVLVLSSSCVFGGLITNGTFDTDATGWTFVGADGITWRDASGQPSGPYTPVPGISGGYAVLNNAPGPVPTMSQSIALVVGNTYLLTWDMTSAYKCCSSSVTPGVGVAIDGNLWEFIVPNDHGWQPYSQQFVYNGGSSALAFSAQRNQTDTDVGIDNIDLVDITQHGEDPPGEIPEPATWILMLSALGAAVVARYRR